MANISLSYSYTSDIESATIEQLHFMLAAQGTSLSSAKDTHPTAYPNLNLSV